MAVAGKFITFEGPEGSGKSTLVRQVSDWFEEKNIPHLTTREPGGNKIGEDIRKIILNNDNTHMDERTEALLYAASRRQHLVETVNPALIEGKVVLCDRYIDSSLVYQGVGRGIGMEEVYEMNMFATEALLPDLTILLDVKPEIGLERISKRKEANNRLDNESLEFHKKVAKAYRSLAVRDRDRIVTFDASGTVEDTFNQVRDYLQEEFFG